MRRLLVSAIVLALGATMSVTSYAVEEPAGTAPEEVSPDQIVTQETSSSAVEGPVMSVHEMAAEKELNALPEVTGEGDIGIERCDNPYKKWYALSGRKKHYHIPSWWNGRS